MDVNHEVFTLIEDLFPLITDSGSSKVMSRKIMNRDQQISVTVYRVTPTVVRIDVKGV